MQLLKDIKTFIKYCDEFYNIETGIYQLATKREIEEAITQYITKAKEAPIMFDSYDREKVREILQPTYKVI